MYSMKLLCFLIFLSSFIFGIILVTLSPMEYKTVIVYPSPSNLTKIQYTDKSDQCFQFSAKLVNCGKHSKKIPIQ